MKRTNLLLLLFFCVAVGVQAKCKAQGDLRLPESFSSGMVLPRGRAITIGGTAGVGERVTVSIHNQRHKAKAGRDGRWEVTLAPLPTGGPYTMTVKGGTKTIIYDNVMAGEVWLCSGQSNMAFRLEQCSTGEEDAAQAQYPNIRFLNYMAQTPTDARAFTEAELDSLKALNYMTHPQWQACTPEAACQMSAIGYYFAQALHDSLRNVPIGIIHNAVGGTPTEAWIARHELEREFPAILVDWTNNDIIQPWVRERAMQNMGGTLQDKRHPYEPSYMYECSIERIKTYPINGVLWYQGESNAHDIAAHEKLFPILIDSWRMAWHRADLPFYFVQLSSLNRPMWPEFRDSQRRLMQAIPHTGMAVSTDIGDSLDVHFAYKRPLGERLARWALHNDYGRTDVTPSGPLCKDVLWDGDDVFVSFEYGEGLHPSVGDVLVGFEVAQDDSLYHPATATVEGNRIRLHCPAVPHPRFVRYAWQPFTRANLVNGDGLPASTFRAEVK